MSNNQEHKCHRKTVKQVNRHETAILRSVCLQHWFLAGIWELKFGKGSNYCHHDCQQSAGPAQVQ